MTRAAWTLALGAVLFAAPAFSDPVLLQTLHATSRSSTLEPAFGPSEKTDNTLGGTHDASDATYDRLLVTGDGLDPGQASLRLEYGFEDCTTDGTIAFVRIVIRASRSDGSAMGDVGVFFLPSENDFAGGGLFELSTGAPGELLFDGLTDASGGSWSCTDITGFMFHLNAATATGSSSQDLRIYEIAIEVWGEPATAPDEVPPAPSAWVWLTPAEILALPMSGSAWSSLLARANQPAGTPNLSDQNDNTNVYVLGKALVYVRTGTESYRTQVRAACMAAIGTEADEPPNNPNGDPNRTLALGRELAAYVIAAQLVGLTPAETTSFHPWLRTCLSQTLEGRTLISTHEDRPNNWGTHAGASRAAVCIYLGLTDQLARCATVFKGYLGDRTAYAGFDYDADLTWACDPALPVGVNPVGCIKSGHLIDGSLTEEMRRGCAFTWPPCSTGYAWEGLQGVVLQAEILARQGYDAWNWKSRAVMRAVRFLHELDRSYGGWWATGDDRWVPWAINHQYRTGFPTSSPSASSPGKNVGWSDWTHPSLCSAAAPCECLP